MRQLDIVAAQPDEAPPLPRLVARGVLPDAYALIGGLVVAPLLEELAFRGAMLRLMRAHGYTRTAAVWINATAFAALHLPGWCFRFGFSLMVVKSFAGIALFGLVTSYLAWSTPTLWGPIALHFANNAWSTRAIAAWLDMLG